MAGSISRLIDYALCGRALGVTLADKWGIFWKETKNIRVQLGLDKYHTDEIYSLNTIYGKLYFRDNFGDITNLPNIFYRHVYRVTKLSRQGIVLDIGANIGLVAALITHYNPDIQIHCFEPLADNSRMIRMNCPSAFVNQIALGAENGQIALEVDQSGVMASKISRPLPTQEVSFKVMTLDEYVAAQEITEVALIKMDAEGMELEIMRGAAHTLKNTWSIVMETHGIDRHQAVLDMLMAADFIIENAQFMDATGMVYAVRDHRSDD